MLIPVLKKALIHESHLTDPDILRREAARRKRRDRLGGRSASRPPPLQTTGFASSEPSIMPTPLSARDELNFLDFAESSSAVEANSEEGVDANDELGRAILAEVEGQRYRETMLVDDEKFGFSYSV